MSLASSLSFLLLWYLEIFNYLFSLVSYTEISVHGRCQNRSLVFWLPSFVSLLKLMSRFLRFNSTVQECRANESNWEAFTPRGKWGNQRFSGDFAVPWRANVRTWSATKLPPTLPIHTNYFINLLKMYSSASSILWILAYLVFCGLISPNFAVCMTTCGTMGIPWAPRRFTTIWTEWCTTGAINSTLSGTPLFSAESRTGTSIWAWYNAPACLFFLLKIYFYNYWPHSLRVPCRWPCSGRITRITMLPPDSETIWRCQSSAPNGRRAWASRTPSSCLRNACSSFSTVTGPLSTNFRYISSE